MKEDNIFGRVSSDKLLPIEGKKEQVLVVHNRWRRKTKMIGFLSNKRRVREKNWVQEKSINVNKTDTDQISSQLIIADEYVVDQIVDHTADERRTA